MLIGHRIRAFRDEKKLSQGEIEKRWALARLCVVGRKWSHNSFHRNAGEIRASG